MNRSCSICGGTHKSNEDCPYKAKRKRKAYDSDSLTIADKFRSTKKWQHKRERINERDNYMCQVCIRKLYNTVSKQYNYDKISVHHIKPLHSHYDLRLDDDNLICLCGYHHKMAEDNDIPVSVLKRIVYEQEHKAHRPVIKLEV